MTHALAIAFGLALQTQPAPCFDLLVLGRSKQAANVTPLFEARPPGADDLDLGATADVLIEVERVLSGRPPPRYVWARDIFTSQWKPTTRVLFYLATDASGAYGVIDDRRARRNWLGRLILPADAPERCPTS